MVNDATAIEEGHRMVLNQARNGASSAPTADQAGDQRKLGSVERGFMIGVTLMFDGAQALVSLIDVSGAIAAIITVWAWLTFFLWFKRKGMSFSGKSGFASAGGKSSLLKNPLFAIAAACGIELVPLVNALPAWTASILIATL